MKADYELISKLEDIQSKYERLCSIISCIQLLLADGCVEVRGLPENALDYSVYELELSLRDNNEMLSELVRQSSALKKEEK